MNLGDIKSVEPAKQSVDKGTTTKQQNGVATAGTAASSSAEVQVSLSNEQARLSASARILQTTFEQNITINNQKLLDSVIKPKESKESVFDFEEVAENVLSFIGGAIKSAKANGMADEELISMFEQAKDGVLKGVEQARKDLAGLMNPEIDEGITRSLNAIKDGIKELEQELLGVKNEAKEGEPVVEEITINKSAGYSVENNRELVVTTAEGDEVTISFASQESVQAQQSLSASVDNEGNQQLSFSTSKAYSYGEQFSFSVNGELNDEELRAIGELVSDSSKLVDEFFNGDVQSAYQQLENLGFDEQQISNFAIEASQTENLETVQRYEQVSRYSEAKQDDFPKAPVRSIADYVEQLVKVDKAAAERLNLPDSFDNLVNDLINRMVKVDTDELLQAINQFNSFNNKLGVSDLFRDKPEPKAEAGEAS
ncbi:MAG: DUF5610 domain-containing protein [Aestuariibacter sp.]